MPKLNSHNLTYFVAMGRALTCVFMNFGHVPCPAVPYFLVLGRVGPAQCHLYVMAINTSYSKTTKTTDPWYLYIVYKTDKKVLTLTNHDDGKGYLPPLIFMERTRTQFPN